MRTLAQLAFIAGVGVIAILLARTPTVAAGRVIEAELLGLVRSQGVTGIVCEPRIPIGRHGATFRCTATLEGGASQRLDCEIGRDGRIVARAAGAPAIPRSRDPWGERP